MIALALAALLALAACDRPATIGVDVVVTIDGEELRYGEFESYLRKNFDGSDPTLESGVESQLFDQFLDEQLLIRLAIERGLVEPGVDQRLAVDFLLRGHRPRRWTDAEIEAYYEAHRAEYVRSEEVRLRQILVQERDVAEEARRAIDRGEDFAGVAARLSEEPKAHLGGDQGWLAREDLPPGFADEVFVLEPGEVSDVVAADYGFLLFQVVARHDAATATVAEVADEIRRALERRRVDELVAGLVEEARERYNVEVFLPNFPFDYRGYYAKRNPRPSD